jgi:mannitol/fructose-specific phosphotransferase system IIA component (Ntr-type)
VVHVKDLFLYQAGGPAGSAPLRELARPFATLHEDVPLDEALARFQRTRHHFAVVRNAAGDWTGILTLEDVLEELVGKIGDEFDVTRSGEIFPLAETLTPGRVVFGVEGPSLAKALASLLSQVPKEELPTEGPAILFAALQRESLMTTYLGRGLAVPHCRIDSLDKPMLIFGRSENGIPLEHTNERAELIFLLLTPSRMARIQPRLLADITGLIESEYVTQRLKNAERPDEIIEAIRDGQQIAIN